MELLQKLGRIMSFIGALIISCPALYGQQPKLVLPFGHFDDVLSSKYSPDNRLIVTLSRDQTAKVWDAASGILLQTLKSHWPWLTQAAFSPDSKKVCITGGSHFASVWDLKNGRLLFDLIGHKSGINSINFSNDGSKLVTSSVDSSSVIWSADNGKPVHRLNCNSWVSTATFNQHGTRVVTASSDGFARVWKVSDGSLLFKLKGGMRSAAFSPDDNYILTYSMDDTTRIYIAATGAFLTSLPSDQQAPNLPSKPRLPSLPFNPSSTATPIFSHSGLYILTANPNSSMTLWDAKSFKIVRTFDTVYKGTNYLKNFCFSYNDKFIGSISSDRVRIWDTETGKLVSEYKSRPECFSIEFDRLSNFYLVSYSTMAQVFDIHTGSLKLELKGSRDRYFYRYDISPSSKYVLSFSDDSSLNMRELVSGRSIMKFRFTSQVYRAGFSANEKFIYAVLKDGSMMVIDPHSGDIKLQSKNYPNITEAEFNERGNYFLTANPSGGLNTFQINAYRIDDGKLIRSFGKFSRFPKTHASANGQYIVVTKRDSIYVFLFETGQLLKAFKVLPGNHRFKGDAADLNFVNDAQISPDLQYLVAGCFSGSFEVWNFQTNEFIGDFTGHRDYINTVNFSSDGKYLITSSADHTAKVWETKSFKQITNLDEHENEVTSAKFTSSGDYIVTKSMDFTFKIWKIHENKSLFTYFPINDKDFLITDSVGRYDGSAAGRKLIYYACGTELITLDQLREITWEDGLVAKLTGADKQAIVAKKLNDIELCGVTPLVEKVVSTGRNYRYKIVPQKGGLGQVLLWVNGVNIRTYRPNELIHHLNYYELLIKPKDIANRLYSDQNNTIDVRAYASNVKLISKGDPTTVDQKDVRNVRHHFYCISAGITLYKGDDLNTLHFASKDAEDMSQTVSLAAKKLLDTDNKESAVSTYLLNTPPPGFNDDKRLLPYRENLRRVFFEVASKATADDIVFIFLSGHGVLQSDQFYYLTADASSFNLDGVENTAAISTDTLKKWLISIPATKKILILDACNSGQTVESLNIKKNIPDDQKRSLAKLNESTATIILAASASGHSAYEMSAYGQGILAYNLLLGIKTGGGLRDNKFVDVSRWFTFASEKVDLMAKDNGERQSPQIWGEGSASGFDVGLADEAIKNKIVLSNKKPFVGRSIAINTDLTTDNLHIEEMIENELTELSYQGKTSKLFFISGAQNADIYRVNCQYQTNGSNITGKMVLVRNDKLIAMKNIETDVNQLRAVIKYIVDHITDKIDD